MIQRDSKIKRIVLYIILAIATIWVVFPFFWALSNSIKPKLLQYEPGKLIPFVQYQPSLNVWKEVALQGRAIPALINSVIVASGTALIVLFISTLAAFALARYEFRLIRGDDITFFFLSQLILPPVVVLIPFFIIMKTLGLLDTRIGLMMVYITFNLPFGVVIMRDAFNNVPLELEEAAIADGANEWQVFYRISLPLVKNGLIAAGLIVFAFAWNEVLFAITLTYSNAQTISAYILGAQTTRGVRFNFAAVNILIAIVPPVLIALLAQRYIVQGLTLGAIKE